MTIYAPFAPDSQCARLLAALKRGPVTNADIIRDMNIFNSTGRISDLRKKGFEIAAKKIAGGLWEYRLECQG